MRPLAFSHLLLILPYVVFSLAQQQQQQLSMLPLNQPLTLSTANLPSSAPTEFLLPSTFTSRLVISIALCSSLSSSSSGSTAQTRFFVSNSTVIPDFSAQDLGPNKGVYEIVTGKDGVGTFVLDVSSSSSGGAGAGAGAGAGIFAVSTGNDSTSMSFQVGVSDRDALHVHLPTLPLLGDTTANQVLLFSPPIAPFSSSPSDSSSQPSFTYPLIPPTYPNYTLPPADLSSPSPPAYLTNTSWSLIIGPTTAFPDFGYTADAYKDGSVPLTMCALAGVGSVGVFNWTSSTGAEGATASGIGGTSADQSLTLRDPIEGWRAQFLVNGLQPSTNYTAFVVENGTRVAGPVFFVTKSASFACPLVHSLPYCPLVAYAAPLPPPPLGSSDSYDATTLPSTLVAPLLSTLTNFTLALSTFACGRDMYSPLVGCAECQSAYRAWLCAVQVPRCGERGTYSPSTGISDRGKRGWMRWRWRKRSDDQAPLTPAFRDRISPPTSTSAATSSSSPADSGSPGTSPPPSPRNTNLPSLNSSSFRNGTWTELLPCLEVCNAVERACPPFLGFVCPVMRFTAAWSYGVGAGADEDGVGGVAQDRWGNVWCNALA